MTRYSTQLRNSGMFERCRPKRHFLPSASSVFLESWKAVQAGRRRVFSRVLRRPVCTMLDFNGFEDPSPSNFFTHNRRAWENNFGASALILSCTRGTESNALTMKLEETFRDLRQLQEAERETDKVVRQLQMTRAAQFRQTPASQDWIHQRSNADHTRTPLLIVHAQTRGSDSQQDHVINRKQSKTPDFSIRELCVGVFVYAGI